MAAGDPIEQCQSLSASVEEFDLAVQGEPFAGQIRKQAQPDAVVAEQCVATPAQDRSRRSSIPAG